MRFFYLLLFYFLGNFIAVAQDTIYLDKGYSPIEDSGSASYFRILEPQQDKKIEVLEKIFFISGQLKSESYYSSYEDRKLEGTRSTFHESGAPHTEAEYKNGLKHGTYISYWENGQMKRKDLFRKGKLKSGTVWNQDGDEAEYYQLMEEPVFPGGMKGLVAYLKENTVTPEGAGGGKVKVKFVIKKDGRVADVEVVQSVSPALDLAAYKVVSGMPNWEPGKHDGEKVNVMYTLPLTFVAQ